MSKYSQDIPKDTPIYQIQVEGWFSERWATSFKGMALSYRPVGPHGAPLAVLTGQVVDQPALRGLLNRLWDLNLSLVCVLRLDGSDDGGSNGKPIHLEFE